MSNLALRIIFGSIYVALVVFCVFYGIWAFVPLMAGFCLLAILEAIRLIQNDSGRSTQMTALVYAGIIVYLCLFQEIQLFKYEYLLGFILQLAVVFFMRARLIQGKSTTLLLNTLYLWLPLMALAVYYTQHSSRAVNDMLFFFITIWLYDSMAYAVGRLIGKRPIFPKVSPKKTIEGTVGGAIVSVVLIYIADKYWLNMEFNVIILGVVVIFFATFGDYLESFYKRKLNIKDSGNLIPGHGGILDRLDSVLFAALPYLVMLILIV